MKILLLNQTFHPEVMATAQYLTELALGLQQLGHDVTVVTGRRAYDQSGTRFAAQEVWRGIRIFRVGSTSFGKRVKWRRAVDFASFLALCCGRLAMLPRHDVVLALTSPPLISVAGATLARWWGARFFYWIMDFNPDEAIAAGWLRAGSVPARILEGLSRYSLGRARKVLALDPFMRDRIAAKGIAPEKIAIMPPWVHEDEVFYDEPGRARFRAAQGWRDQFVVMYSGNHSPVHPLDTLLEAARRLAHDPGVFFCFVGGGSEFSRVELYALNQRLTNVRCLPYQPLAELSASLSAADLQGVVMGDAMVGLVHPCKIYNILGVGAPVLYVGPQLSHVSSILAQAGPEYPSASCRHGDVSGVVAGILRLRDATAGRRRAQASEVMAPYAKRVWLPRLIAELTA